MRWAYLVVGAHIRGFAVKPQDNSYTFAGFALYRKYDGAGSTFRRYLGAGKQLRYCKASVYASSDSGNSINWSSVADHSEKYQQTAGILLPING
ncbi:MAG: hypothetical protein U0165_09980 [Polyangiaceae bacterium]